MPTFLHLFRPNPASILTLRKLTMLLTPSFSPEGSNRKKFETEVYSLFVKYLREAASLTTTQTAISRKAVGKYILNTQQSQKVIGTYWVLIHYS